MVRRGLVAQCEAWYGKVRTFLTRGTKGQKYVKLSNETGELLEIKGYSVEDVEKIMAKVAEQRASSDVEDLA